MTQSFAVGCAGLGLGGGGAACLVEGSGSISGHSACSCFPSRYSCRVLRTQGAPGALLVGRAYSRSTQTGPLSVLIRTASRTETELITAGSPGAAQGLRETLTWS